LPSTALYACKATIDIFLLNLDDFCPQVEKVLTVGEFYDLSGGAEIILHRLFRNGRECRRSPRHLISVDDLGRRPILLEKWLQRLGASARLHLSLSATAAMGATIGFWGANQ
jgi:hypothetical protein